MILILIFRRVIIYNGLVRVKSTAFRLELCCAGCPNREVKWVSVGFKTKLPFVAEAEIICVSNEIKI